MAYGHYRRESAVLEGFTTLSPLPYPVLLILLVVLALLALSWFCDYESFMEDAGEQIGWALLVVPLLLVLLIRWLSSVDSFDNYLLYGLLPLDSQRRYPHTYQAPPSQGSSPWGVAALLVLLLVMAYFRSAVEDMWGP